MLNLGFLLGALIAPLAVWGLILRAMAASAEVHRPFSGFRAGDAEIERLSPEEMREEQRAQSRYVNARYEENFNYHRAA